MNRREFIGRAARELALGTVGLCAGATLLPSWLEAGDPDDPHFFLQIFISGGMDSSYLFDARPLSMTAAGAIQNYLGEEPKSWPGENGERTLATRLVDKLARYRHRFSVVNGIVMSTGFDGHPQNINCLFSGNPFGGDSFIPRLNAGEEPLLLDTLMDGRVPGSFRNLDETIPLSAASGGRLIEKNASVTALDPGNPLIAHIRSRMAANGKGAGRFSAEARLMARAYDEAPRLSRRLSGMNLSFVSGEDDPEGRFLEMMARFFERKICRSALIAFDSKADVDTHDAGSAARQPETYEKITNRLGRIFQFLEETEFLPGRSLWDLTTVCVASEFGRTMRQGTKPLDRTGTDHNPVANSILLGGRGIRGGWVVGATDRMSLLETISEAHSQLDPLGVKVMARPFDFERFLPRTDLPREFQAGDYISIESVVNSIYSLFGVDRRHWWSAGRNGPAAQILKPLLTL